MATAEAVADGIRGAGGQGTAVGCDVTSEAKREKDGFPAGHAAWPAAHRRQGRGPQTITSPPSTFAELGPVRSPFGS
jgi:hypothetical protein